MITVHSPDGERRLVHSVDLPGYLTLGWSTERIEPLSPESESILAEPDPVVNKNSVGGIDSGITAEEISSLSWRDQKSLLSEQQQEDKPDNYSWEDWAIACLVEG